LTESWCF